MQYKTLRVENNYSRFGFFMIIFHQVQTVKIIFIVHGYIVYFNWDFET